MKTEFNRFDSKVDRTGDCWEWTGATYRFGYGHFRRKVNNQWIMYKAHRYSYEYYVGEIPKGLCILHSCDNPRCVNPAHLSAGTHKQNTQDATNRGRKSFGRNTAHSWLSFEKAEHMRQFAIDNPDMLQKDMAQYLGTSTAQLSRILNHKIWSVQ
jgi:hypothetical protein